MIFDLVSLTLLYCVNSAHIMAWISVIFVVVIVCKAQVLGNRQVNQCQILGTLYLFTISPDHVL